MPPGQPGRALHDHVAAGRDLAQVVDGLEHGWESATQGDIGVQRYVLVEFVESVAGQERGHLRIRRPNRRILRWGPKGSIFTRGKVLGHRTVEAGITWPDRIPIDNIANGNRATGVVRRHAGPQFNNPTESFMPQHDRSRQWLVASP